MVDSQTTLNHQRQPKPWQDKDNLYLLRGMIVSLYVVRCDEDKRQIGWNLHDIVHEVNKVVRQQPILLRKATGFKDIGKEDIQALSEWCKSVNLLTYTDGTQLLQLPWSHIKESIRQHDQLPCELDWWTKDEATNIITDLIITTLKKYEHMCLQFEDIYQDIKIRHG